MNSEGLKKRFLELFKVRNLPWTLLVALATLAIIWGSYNVIQHDLVPHASLRTIESEILYPNETPLREKPFSNSQRSSMIAYLMYHFGYVMKVHGNDQRLVHPTKESIFCSRTDFNELLEVAYLQVFQIEGDTFYYRLSDAGTKYANQSFITAQMQTEQTEQSAGDVDDSLSDTNRTTLLPPVATPNKYRRRFRIDTSKIPSPAPPKL